MNYTSLIIYKYSYKSFLNCDILYIEHLKSTFLKKKILLNIFDLQLKPILQIVIYVLKFNYTYPNAILSRKGPVIRAMRKRLQDDWARAAEKGSRALTNLRVDFWAHGLTLGPIIFVHIILGCHYIWSLYLGFHNVDRVP